MLAQFNKNCTRQEPHQCGFDFRITVCRMYCLLCPIYYILSGTKAIDLPLTLKDFPEKPSDTFSNWLKMCLETNRY